MRASLQKFFGSLFAVDPSERVKLVFLSLSYAFIIGAYNLATELKNSIFMSVVGKEMLPAARIYSILVLIPLIFFYSRLVDLIRRYQLVYFYSIAYGALGLLFTYFLSHETIGIPNSVTSPYRMFGWLFYFYVEGYSPFVVSVFWAFANSISSPESAKKNYALMVAGSKLGGVLTSILAIMLLSAVNSSGGQLFTDTRNHQILLGVASLLLFMVPIFISLLMKLVPGKVLHGYEAAYKFEKQRAKEELHHKPRTMLQETFVYLYGMFDGLILFVKQPYVLGIFCMTFFYDMMYVIFSYLRLAVIHSSSASMNEVSSSLFKTIFFVHFIGLIFSLVGTRPLLNKLGERICLLLIPSFIAILCTLAVFNYTPFIITFAWIALKSLNYAFSKPINESLYIPTVKDLKFKSKSWIDAFGSKIAKGGGSYFNIIAERFGPAFFVPLHASFFAGILAIWSLAAYLLGKRFDKAIANNEVIGSEEELVA